MAKTVPPNYVLGETELDAMLPVISSAQGLPQNTLTPDTDHATELAFSNVYDGELEAKARAIYPRDYEFLVLRIMPLECDMPRSRLCTMFLHQYLHVT